MNRKSKGIKHKWPLPNNISRKIVNSPFHNYPGLENAKDLLAPEGTSVYASRSGKVIDVKSDSNIWGKSQEFAKYANYIIIKCEDGTFDEYVHFRKDDIFVKKDQDVKVGDQIGHLGYSGFMSETHLHLNCIRRRENGKFESLPIEFEFL